MKKFVVGLMLVLSLASCGKKNETESIKTKPIIKFAALYPMSGDGAHYGQTAQEVYKMFMEDFRKNNPNSKYEYEVIFEDVQFSAAKTATAMQKVAYADKVSAVFAITSSQGMVINPIAEKNEIIQLSYAVDPKVADGKYNFTISTSISNIADMTIAKMKENNVKKVAFITLSNDVASVKVTDAIVSRLKENNLENVGQYMIHEQEKDFTIMLEKVRSGSPDIIVFEALPPTADVVLRRLKMLGIDIPVTGIWTMTSLNDKTLANGFWFVDDGEATQEFVKRYEQRVGTKGTHYGEYLYTILTVLTNAFENTKSEDGKAPATSDVVETLMRQTKGMQSALGVLDIDENGEIGLLGTYKRMENGKVVKINE